MTPPLGRPPVPDDERKTTVVTTRASPDDAATLNRAAALVGKKTGPWLLELGLREAGKIIRKAERENPDKTRT